MNPVRLAATVAFALYMSGVLVRLSRAGSISQEEYDRVVDLHNDVARKHNYLREILQRNVDNIELNEYDRIVLTDMYSEVQ